MITVFHNDLTVLSLYNYGLFQGKHCQDSPTFQVGELYYDSHGVIIPIYGLTSCLLAGFSGHNLIVPLAYQYDNIITMAGP